MKPKAITGTKAMIVSPHHLASAAGARILLKGGNAFDAAVAISACLSVVYPHMTGLGGDACWLMYSASERLIRSYDASGATLKNAGLALADSSIPQRGPGSVLTVPGMADGWDAIIKEYGRLTLGQVLEPAIDYAVNGFPLGGDLHGAIESRALMLSEEGLTARTYLPFGRIPKAGSLLVQKQLGESLSLLAAKGRDAFYDGELAEEMVSYLAGRGGLITREDLSGHSGQWGSAASVSYRGYNLCLASHTQGQAGAIAAQMLEAQDFGAVAYASSAYYHILIEAAKLARSRYDRDQLLGAEDSGSGNAPESSSYEGIGRVRMDRAAPDYVLHTGSGGAYAAVVDGEGNAISFCQSLHDDFGSLVTAGSTGILLSNRGASFSQQRDQNYAVQAGHRYPQHLMPAIALQDGKPAMLFGASGEGQLQTLVSLLTRMADYSLSPEQAVQEPRWLWGRDRGETSPELKLEKPAAAEAADQLRKLGHPVKLVQALDASAGQAHAIKVEAAGYLSGAVDPRSDGTAIGW